MASTTTYEFLPEIWNLIKEYAIPEKYEYDEEDCIYEVEIYRFLEQIEDDFEKEDYSTTKMVVETNGVPEDTTITFKNAITDRYIDELVVYLHYDVKDGCCQHSMIGGWCRTEFMLSDLMPEDLDDEWGRTEVDDYHYTDLKLVIELGEKGNCKFLIDQDIYGPENPIHTYGDPRF